MAWFTSLTVMWVGQCPDPAIITSGDENDLCRAGVSPCEP